MAAGAAEPGRPPARVGARAALALAACLFAAGPAAAEGGGRRVALVIGNEHYRSFPPLRNPEFDTRLVAGTLGRLGFEVSLAADADRPGILAALRSFGDAAAGAEVALVYYSGHGLQVDGVNYLVPVTANLRDPDPLTAQGVTLPTVLAGLQRAHPAFGILILDACRDNPLPALGLAARGPAADASPGGLARVDPAAGLLIAYATAPGQVAFDGPPGRNSPFAASLAHYLDQPGLEVALLFRKVSERVRELTAGAQVPWTESALTGNELYLNPASPPAPAASRDALNAALALDEPKGRELALRAFLAGRPDPALAAIAEARLAATPAAPARDDRPFAAELADWRLAASLGGGKVGHLAASAFLALHPDGRFAADARAALDETEESGAPAADAEEAVWPLVARADGPGLYDAFLASFPAGRHAEAARAAVRLAALAAAPPPPSPSPPPDAPAPLLVTSYVGTEGTPIPLPPGTGRLTLTEPPRHGRLLLAGRGQEAPLAAGAIPVAAAGGLRYEPDVDARDVVDGVAFDVAAAGDAPATRGLAAPAPPRLVARIEVRVHPCDRLAGLRLDVQGVTLGLLPNEIDPARAVPACREAVAAFPGVPRLRYELGRALDAGSDYAGALAAYRAAADAGHAAALNAIGYLHERGRGVPRDAKRAVALWREAAGRGELYAMNNLGRAYRDGLGVRRSRDAAADWFRRAAAHGNTFAYNNLGAMLLDEGERPRALALFRAAAEAGDVYGFNNLGQMYENGWGVRRDLGRAVGWYERAADGGQPDAPISLGLLYRDGGPGLPADPRQAARWFALAADRKVAWGYVHLAGLYRDGRLDGRADPRLAAQLLARAAALGGADDGDKEAAGAARAAFAALPRAAAVGALRAALARAGRDPGPADGLVSPATAAAAPLIDLLGAALAAAGD